MKKAIISLLVAGAVVAANAQDKALLETLVKRACSLSRKPRKSLRIP